MHVSRTRTIGSLLLIAGAALAAACGDDHPRAPTAPPSFNISGAAAQCSADTAKVIANDIKTLFKTTKDRNAASTRWKAITSSCLLGNQTAIQSAVAGITDYFRFFLDVKAQGGLQGTPAVWAAHFNRSLLYGTGEVLGPLNAGVTARAFDDSGAVGVCTVDQTCTLVTTWAALRVDVGAIGKKYGTTYDSYLFTIAPVANSECQKENLRFHGPCHDFSVNPATTFKPPYVTLATCIADESLVVESHRYLHAIPTPSAADNGTLVKVLPTAATPLALACANTPSNFLAMAPASTGVFASAWRGLGGAAARVLDVFAPRPLFAIHTTSSSTSTLPRSPVGIVDPLILGETWEAFPTGALAGSYTAEWGGKWFAFATAPGSITVQSSFLGHAGRTVVLDQAGGNCSQNCGGLQLTAAIDSLPATGVYRLSWLSVEDAPTAKLAPFVLRSSPRLSTPADTLGDTVAVVAYRSKSSADKIVFITAHGTDVVASWRRGVWQKLVVDVDLGARTATLTVLAQDGVTVLGQAGPFTFVSTNAKDLRRIAAEFSGIDAGVVGWDEIDARRIADRLPF